MQPLKFPEYSFNIKAEGQRKLIYDRIRKKYVVLTPEEWVRQHAIAYLITDKEYPAGLISVEKGLRVNQQQRRTDIVIYGRNASPLMLVECKAPEVKIDQKTFEQIAQYNLTFKVNYLWVTNGLQHYTCRLDLNQKTYTFLEELPRYEALG